MFSIICILLISQTSQASKTCDSTFDYINGVVWSSTSDKSLSKPICLDQNKEFLYRECSSGEWNRAPFCYSLQQETLPQCPYGFTDTGNLCYQLTSKSSYPPKCPFKNTVPFYYYKDLVTSDFYGSIWVPAERKNLTFMEWTEPSWLYRQEITNYTFTKPLQEKQCLVYFRETYTAVSCNSKYTGVCAYTKLDQLTYNLCHTRYNCRQSDFDVSSKCFCQATKSLPNYQAAEFVRSYQYNIYEKLTNETCTIGLKKTSSGKYIWENSGKFIDYAFWSPATNFSDRNFYAAGTPDGWILAKNPPPCIIFQTEIASFGPKLDLDFDAENYRFILTVVHPQGLKRLTGDALMFCFTNSDGIGLIYKYPTIEIIREFETSIVYSFDPLQNVSGYYWCESFKHTNSEIITTGFYFLKSTDFLEFVGIFQISYNNETNPFSSDIINLLQNRLFSNIDVSYVQAIRIMRVTDLDEDLQLVCVNVHFTASEKVLPEDAETQYNLVRTYLEDILEDNEDIKLIDFQSADFCVSEKNASLTWPKTPIGSVASPEEFCFTVDANPVKRTCDGNFISGAQWSPVESCQIFEPSPITEQLLQVSTNSSDQSMIEIYEISQDYLKFNSLDVYLVGKLYNNFIYIRNISVFGETVSNLLKINRSELFEAQLKLGATDLILNALDHVNFKSEITFEVSFQNFYLVSLRSKDLSGLVVVKNDDQYEIIKLKENYYLENLTQIDNLVSAIWLSPELRNDLWVYEKVTFTIYFSEAFFSQDDDLDAGIILGMLRSKSSDYFYGPVYIIHRSRQHMDSYCSFWGYSPTKRGSWKRFRKVTPYPPFLMCDYWYFGNYAIITPGDSSGGDHDHNHDHEDTSDVTDDLIDLLGSNTSVPETMEKLSQISEEFYCFTPVDLSFVGQILQRVSDDDDVDFTNLAKTVNNIQRVPRDVLRQSQIDEESTDKILTSIDHIIKRHSFTNTVTIISHHFMIFVIDPKDSITGIALFGRDDFVKPQLLYSNDSIEDISEQEDFDSAVIFSRELQQQIFSDEKIIIMVYLNDALFNEKSPSYNTFVSRVFDVILPDIGDFNGPLSVFFRNNAPSVEGAVFDQSSEEIVQNFSQSKQCVFWFYDQDVPGFWKRDHDLGNSSNVIQCDYWHTTHFAYLILDQDRFNDVFDQFFDILGLLTSINCSISLIGLILIVLTAVLFKQWRQNSGNKILLNFSFVIIIQIVVFYASNLINQGNNYFLCTIIGIFLHYSIVSQFCWMFVIAILQFRRFVIVLEGPPSYVLLKACVCGWVLPLFPVCFVFALDRENYVKSNVGLCYPSGLGLYLGVWLPICIIILINFVIFSITLYSVIHKKTEYVNSSSEALYQWRLAVLLFFMLGFTWCFAFLAELDFGLVFEYLFCMTATLQGFTLFLFFILFNANTRSLYITAVSKYCKRKFR